MTLNEAKKKQKELYKKIGEMVSKKMPKDKITPYVIEVNRINDFISVFE